MTPEQRRAVEDESLANLQRLRQELEETYRRAEAREIPIRASGPLKAAFKLLSDVPEEAEQILKIYRDDGPIPAEVQKHLDGVLTAAKDLASMFVLNIGQEERGA